MTFGIRAKLLAAFVVLALFTGALGWYAVGSMERMNEGQRTLYGDIFGGTHLLARWIDTSWEGRTSLMAYLLTEDAAARSQLRAKMASLDAVLDDLAGQMDAADTDREDVETLSALTQAWHAFAEWRDQSVVARVEAGDRASADASYQAEGFRRVAALDHAIDAFLDKKGGVGSSLEASAQATFERTRAIAAGLAVLATGLALLIGFFLSRGIAGAARQVATAAKALALGDLSPQLAVRSKDELGEMVAAFRDMVAYQQEMASVADAIAHGDLTRTVQPKSDRDVLGSAVHRMGSNLRMLIGELRQAVEHNQALNAELERRVAERTAQLEAAVGDLRQQVAERQRAEVELRESEERYRQMFQRNQAIKLLIDPASGAIVDANGAAAEFYGYPRAELLRRRITEINTLAPDEVAAEMTRAAAEERSYFLFRHRLASGEVRDVEVHSSPVNVGGRELLYSILHDITDRRHAEALLRYQKSLLEAQGEASPDGILAVSPEGRILSFNRRFAEIWRLSDEVLATRSDEAALGAVVEQLADPSEFLARVADLYAHPEQSSHEEVALKDGRTLDRYSAPVLGAHGASYGRVWFFRDITAHKQAENALRHQALHDQLTELPNRALLHDRLEQAILAATRGESSLALLVMDLDRFKEINDTFGHHCGDLLLQEAGRRLREALRASDTIARLGGDEFAVLLPAADATAATRVAGLLRRTLERSFTLEGQRIDVGASVGIALYPEHGADPDTLLRRADVAMYMAKRAGGGAAVYAADQDQHSPDRLALIAELRQAIEQDQLSLHFQPKVDLTGGLCGVEALVRWHHPQRGFIPPDQFVPLAEHTGLISPLTRWVLDAALRQCRAWRNGGSEIPVAVNVSMYDLHDAAFPDLIAGLLATHGVPASCLRVEITEGAIMADPARTLDVLTRLRALGVRTAVDDFGTGYSSLAYLKRLPVDELKIDRSFVRHLADDGDDAAIVRSTIGLSHDLGLVVVAEGVEDQAAWDLLAQFGCDLVQGYFVSRPLPAEAFARWVRESSLDSCELKAA